MRFALFLLLLLGHILPAALLQALDSDKWLQAATLERITVDLSHPSYGDGVLSTDRGGVISAPHIRIQARHMRYTRQTTAPQPVWNIAARGDLLVEFGDYVFAGESLFYNFQSQEGVIIQGKSMVEPWHFGGEKLELRADGSCLLYNGYVTTSERDPPDWGIYSHLVTLEQERFLKAQQVHVKVAQHTVFWIPALRANLDAIFDNPIRYRFRWGGRQGPRFGLTYEVFSWQRWKTFVRFDYRLTRGLGGGLETYYRALDHKTEFHSINYLAKDASILHPHAKARYRFEGVFKKLMDHDRTALLVTYDKISDKDMPSSYYDRDFDFDTSERTQWRLRRQEQLWITHFYTRIRINSFQTVLQELPTLTIRFKPFTIGRTGIIAEHLARASYLNFEYAKHLAHVHDYGSTRCQYFPSFYRPMTFGRWFSLTPEVGMIAALYGHSPSGTGQWLLLGRGSLNLHTRLYRQYDTCKHVVQPYVCYRYYSPTTASPHRRYIFDMSDGWTRLSSLALGTRHAWYPSQGACSGPRIATADIYTYAFFHNRKMGAVLPCLYGQLTFFLHSAIKHVGHLAWNFQHNQLHELNFRSEWTLNADAAIACEYRHRGPYDWRKIDAENFFLDAFHSQPRLRRSQLSDRRDTLLIHFFYRFHPNWSCEFISRSGWHRAREPSYFEYELNILTTVQTAWHLRFSLQHQENDNRVALYLNIGLKRPD